MKGQAFFPNAAYNPHQEKIASNRANPDKNRVIGSQVVEIAQISKAMLIEKRSNRSDLPIFLSRPQEENDRRPFD